MNTPAGLYIHIPFCKSKCPYCHFYSTVPWGVEGDADTGTAIAKPIEESVDGPTKAAAVGVAVADAKAHPGAAARAGTDKADTAVGVARFIDALEREMRGYRHLFAAFDTIYIGGGTPSLLTIADLDRILAAARRHFTVAGDAETTVEVNPADGDAAWFSDLRALGVTRVHLGAQSFSPAALQFLGRRHTVRDVYEAAARIRGAGFDNFGLDLIWGLPGQTIAEWRRDLAAALSLAPAHLSAYQLSAEPGTPLRRRLRRGEFALPDEEAAREFFLATDEFLRHAGFLHYEISSYARHPETVSRHNGKYWRHIAYLGLGPSAHSFQDGRRWWNRRNLDEYLTILEAGGLPVAASETLGHDELRLETLFLGLRTAAGIDLNAFRRRFGEELRETRQGLLAALITDTLNALDGDRLRPTPRGMAVADGLSVLL